MAELVSENFEKRSVICNILLMLFLFVPVLICSWSILVIPAMMFMDGMGLVFIPLEINCIIAMFAVYGFLFKNKKAALLIGITTLYSILIAISPFFTTASDPVEGLTSRDYMNDFRFSFIFGLVVCLIVLVVLMLPLLIRKNHHSAMSLLENGGIFVNAKMELFVVVMCNMALIGTAYMECCKM